MQDKSDSAVNDSASEKNNKTGLIKLGKSKSTNALVLSVIIFLIVLVIFAIIFVYFKAFGTSNEHLSHEELKRRKLKGYIDTQLDKGETIEDIEKKLKQIGYSQEEINGARG